MRGDRAALNPPPRRRRWLVLVMICSGVLMIVVDSTIVNVALPSIREALSFTESSLVWVVNAYLVTFGGFLLLAGRLSDLYGERKLFLVGVVLFTVASLACGFARTPLQLVAARACQGFGSACIRAAALALIMALFPEVEDRSKALGVYGFVSGGGGSLGLLVGGAVTDLLGWHWIFLINVPLGITVYLVGVRLLPRLSASPRNGRLDVLGAFLATSALMLAVYACVEGGHTGWSNARVIVLGPLAVGLFALFLLVESRSSDPVVPLRVFKVRGLLISNAIGVLWAAGTFAWSFISALCMQRLLGYSPLQVGLAFVPANLAMALCSMGLATVLMRLIGVGGALCTGLLMSTAGLALFARIQIGAHLLTDVLPGMLLLGVGAGIAFNPLLMAAMSRVAPAESGLASGLINTALMMGGALGLAIIASFSAARAEALLHSGVSSAQALLGGYRAAFGFGAILVGGAVLLGAILLISRERVAAAVPSKQ